MTTTLLRACQMAGPNRLHFRGSFVSLLQFDQQNWPAREDPLIAAGAGCASRSLLKLRICNYPNPTRQRGIVFLRFGSVSENPSLTLRVGIYSLVFELLINRKREVCNFKTEASPS